MPEFVRQCFYCADTRSGEVVPRPLGETVHGTAPNEVVHFDYLHEGESGPQASQGLPEDGDFRYILVIMDDLKQLRVGGTCGGLYRRSDRCVFVNMV